MPRVDLDFLALTVMVLMGGLGSGLPAKRPEGSSRRALSLERCFLVLGGGMSLAWLLIQRLCRTALGGKTGDICICMDEQHVRICTGMYVAVYSWDFAVCSKFHPTRAPRSAIAWSQLEVPLDQAHFICFFPSFQMVDRPVFPPPSGGPLVTTLDSIQF